MNSFVLLATLALVAAASALPKSSGATYTDKYDNLNIPEILENRRLLVGYVNCCLDIGRCTAEGNELKSHIREALENFCGKCTEHQRTGTRQVLGHLINQEPELWTKLCDKYDKDRKYTARYEKELRQLKAH